MAMSLQMLITSWIVILVTCVLKSWDEHSFDSPIAPSGGFHAVGMQQRQRSCTLLSDTQVSRLSLACRSCASEKLSTETRLWSEDPFDAFSHRLRAEYSENAGFRLAKLDLCNANPGARFWSQNPQQDPFRKLGSRRIWAPRPCLK